MKNVAIILILTVLFAVGGFWGTGAVMVELDRSRGTGSAPKTTERERPITWEDIAETEREFDRAIEGLIKRQDAAILAGGVGAVVGFFAGLVIVLYKGKRRGAHQSMNDERE